MDTRKLIAGQIINQFQSEQNKIGEKNNSSILRYPATSLDIALWSGLKKGIAAELDNSKLNDTETGTVPPQTSTFEGVHFYSLHGSLPDIPNIKAFVLVIGGKNDEQRRLMEDCVNGYNIPNVLCVRADVPSNIVSSEVIPETVNLQFDDCTIFFNFEVGTVIVGSHQDTIPMLIKKTLSQKSELDTAVANCTQEFILRGKYDCIIIKKNPRMQPPLSPPPVQDSSHPPSPPPGAGVENTM